MRQRLHLTAFLPDDLRAAIARRVCEIGGVALMTVAAALAAALASWSVQDPSLSHATSAPVRNLLGVPGAIAADLLMQLIGVGAGSYRKLAVPARKFGSPVKVIWPYWLSAITSLDWNGCNHTPTRTS